MFMHTAWIGKLMHSWGGLISALGSGGHGYGARLPIASRCSLGKMTSVFIGIKGAPERGEA